ncbi:hypothetical protein D3C76_03300 [compost metagenome]
MKISDQIKGFFESYEVINELSDKKGIRVEIFESSNRDLIQVKLIEKALTNINGVGKGSTNLFFDVKVEGSIVKMFFKFSKIADNDLKKVIKAVIKSEYSIKLIGNQLTISAIDPRVSEVKKIFMELEPYCRRFV